MSSIFRRKRTTNNLYNLYITQSQTVTNVVDINVPVVRSVSTLVASFITFYNSTQAPSTGCEYCNKEFCRFYHPQQASDEQASRNLRRKS